MAHQLSSVTETRRLEELHSFSILDSLPDDDYDNLTAIAAQICETPVSLITMVDHQRQWFKSHHGLDISETPREHSFCSHAIVEPNIFVIEDAREDARFSTNPLVTDEPYIVFYAGVPLITEGGIPLGTLCVIDREPRKLTESQIQSLEALSNQVIKLLELRRKKHQLTTANEKLKEKNEMLDHFAHLAAHDLKSPLNNIQMITDAFIGKHFDHLDKESQDHLVFIQKSAENLNKMVKGLLENAKADQISEVHQVEISTKSISEDLLKLFNTSYEKHLTFEFHFDRLTTSKSALMSVFINLISNAFKYNDKVISEVEVGGRELDERYEFFVSDNGPGIAPENQEKIFEMFTVLQPADRDGEYSTGIGLANVKKIINQLNGEITVDSSMGEGTIFVFSIPK